MTTIMRVISRLIIGKSSQCSPLRMFSTAPEAAVVVDAPPLKPSKRNLFFSEVVEKSSKSSIPVILDNWVNEGKQVKKNYISDLINYFRYRKNFSAALQLYDWMDSSSSLKISNADQAIHIDVLCKGKGLDFAEKYFNSLQESEKTEKTYGALLRCYGREGVSDKALEISQMMKELGYATALNDNNEQIETQHVRKRDLLFKEVVRKSSNSSVVEILDNWVNEGKQVKKVNISDLLHYFRNRNNFRAALQLYEWMDRSSKLNISNGDEAMRIDLLYKGKGVDFAENYFNSLQESEKTDKTYGALLSCYCRASVFDKALEIFEKMKVLNYTSTLNYNNMLSLYHNMGQHENIISLVQEMEEKNIAADRYTYNLLINSYAALKNLDAVEAIVEKMKSSTIKPDSFTYGNLANVYYDSGLHEKADAVLGLMEQMETEHDKDKLNIYHTQLRLYSMMNNLPGVNRAWEALKSAFPTPLNTSYLLMLLALSKLGDTENLENTFKEWEKGCSTYDFRLPNVLLEYYINRDMIEEANSLYKGMENRGSEPNLKALNLFVNLCIRNRQIDMALNYLEMGLVKKSKPGNKWFPTDDVIKLFVDYFEVNDDTDRAEKFIQSMKKHNRLDSSSLLSNMKVLDARS